MRIGVAGLGIMGSAFARRYLELGHEVYVWNRDPNKAADLMESGAKQVETPAELAAGVDIVITCLKDDAALKEVSCGDNGVLFGMGAETIHCDTSTILSETAIFLANEYDESDRVFAHAPVLGSKSQIAGGDLLVFASCPDRGRDALEQAFKNVAKRIWWFNEAGQAAALKLSCNALIASMICSLSQSLAYGKKFGVDPELFLEVLAESALDAPMYQKKSRQILKRDFQANFVVDNLIKDINLVLESAGSAGVSMPMLATLQQMFLAASAEGYGQEDYSAISIIFEKLSGVDLGEDNR